MVFRNLTLIRLGVLAALLAVFGLRGCFHHTAGSSGNPFSSVNTNPTGGKVELASDDQRMRTKLQPIIECLNGSLTGFEEATEGYRRKIDDLEHPSDNRIIGLDLWQPSFSPAFGPNQEKDHDVKECVANLEKGAGMRPSIADLDTDAKAAAETLRRLIGPGLEFDDYVAQKRYLDDKFAKGRSLDATITPTLHELAVLTEKIRSESERENSVVRRHELAAIDKQEGHNLHWHTQNCMIEARALDNRIEQLSHSGALSPTAVQAAMQPLQAAVDGAHAFVQAHPDTKTPPANGNSPMWFGIENDLVQELVKTRELHHALEQTPEELAARQPFPETPQDHVKYVHEDVTHVNDAFNSLIRSYNQTAEYSR